LKINMEYSESVYRRTDNTMAKKKEECKLRNEYPQYTTQKIKD